MQGKRVASARDCEALRSQVLPLKAMRFEVLTYPLNFAVSAGNASGVRMGRRRVALGGLVLQSVAS